MAKHWTRLWLLSAMSLLMAACQSIDTLKLKWLNGQQSDQHAQIFCAGAPDCEFERFDNSIIVDAKSGRVTAQAIKQKWVRLQDKQRKEASPIYLSVPAGRHELVIRFYPISKQKAETFHLFQNFKAGQVYTASMYRQRINHSTNLLNASVPDPLCVDLKQGQKTIRRFCKPYNIETGIAEFVEQKI